MDIEVRALPQLSSMLIAWAALLLLYLMLRKFLYKPVSNFLNARKEKIQGDLDGAKALNEEAVHLKEDYEGRINQAKLESQQIIENARKRGEEVREDIIAEAKLEAETIINKARKEIAREKEIALQDVKSQAGEMAILIASRIMEEQVNMDTQKNLINKFIDEVGKSKWQS
ncbi:F0F1 ATP synthase subunit B [Tissierella sp. MSJ-40]|uniref:ATP synthase subunit b n=1 Tax=Tissierella simiarum TaxID=2841534 RepID=A0ABS6E1E4_9FIRM|nr:F0F1 ATP synthase subunit B [Tissierella simiarum]MBU5436727.1 F0F1 ATP synthase subunit B [Tissierella simiarum]